LKKWAIPVMVSILILSIGFSQQVYAILSIDPPVTLDSTGDVGQYTSIAIGNDGFPVISYWDNTNGDLKAVHCTNASCSTFDTPIALVTAGIVGQFTSIAIGNDGFPVISYYDNTNADLKAVHCTNASCSTIDTPVTLDTTGDVGFYASIAIGNDGFPVISYWDQTNRDLKAVHCTNASCSTFDTPVSLDTTDDVGEYASIAIGNDGFPVIGYHDNTNQELKVVHCTNASCSTFDTPAPLDSETTRAKHISIAIGNDGFPVISYQEIFEIMVVHCTNASCSTFDTPVTLDSNGEFISIAIGNDGFPVISYHRADSNQELKVVHCTNASCSTFDTPISLDTIDDVGLWTSIAIGNDGFPVISYADFTTRDLKVVHCTDENCEVDPPTAQAIGGTSIPIDTTALLVAGAQTMTPWLILVVISAVGIGLAVFTLKRSR